MQASPGIEGEPPRKRLHRDIKSCYQCRKRKVKCQFTSEPAATCTACIKAGTKCTLAAPSAGASGNNLPTPVLPEDRLQRLENMLATLIQTQGLLLPVGLNSLAMPLLGGELSTSLSHMPPFWEGMPPNLVTHSETLPFNGPNPSLPVDAEAQLKKSLVSLLPSQEDAITLVNHTTAWLWGLRSTPGSTPRSNEPIADLNMSAISIGTVMDVAKALLYLAIYMQQLPADFDVQLLQIPNIDAAIESYVDRVNSLVLSKEEVVCSAEGLECLHLLAMLHINEGSLRKGWLTFRRALDVAKLKGLRDSYTTSSQQLPPSELATRRIMWRSTIAGDCYCSLLLGLEPVLGSAPFGPESRPVFHGAPDGEEGEEDEKFEQRFYPIVARLAQQRFLGLHGDYDFVRRIDQDLDKLWESMTTPWQQTPTLRPGRSLESAKDYSRLMCHLWFFMTRIYVHLPFAFSTPGTSGRQCSRDRCLEASRIIINWYFTLQQEGKGHPRCKVTDIAAFLAAVTVLLTEIDRKFRDTATLTRVPPAYSSDTALLEQFIHSLEMLGQSSSREHLARQGAAALSAMTAAAKAMEGTGFHDPQECELSWQLSLRIKQENWKSGLEEVLISSFRTTVPDNSAAARIIDLAFPSVP